MVWWCRVCAGIYIVLDGSSRNSAAGVAASEAGEPVYNVIKSWY